MGLEAEFTQALEGTVEGLRDFGSLLLSLS